MFSDRYRQICAVVTKERRGTGRRTTAPCGTDELSMSLGESGEMFADEKSASSVPLVYKVKKSAALSLTRPASET